MLNRTLLLILLTYPPVSHAINVGSVTTFIDVGSQSISKEIENNSDQARLITVSVSRISSPEENGVEIPMTDGELLLSPARMMLPAKAKNNVRFSIQVLLMTRSATTGSHGLTPRYPLTSSEKNADRRWPLPQHKLAPFWSSPHVKATLIMH
ncbi:hypothetical protein ACSZNU_11805 [Aeromonas hydrophila]